MNFNPPASASSESLDALTAQGAPSPVSADQIKVNNYNISIQSSHSVARADHQIRAPGSYSSNVFSLASTIKRQQEPVSAAES
tara:strand:+ start:636 stop:884 length:249 start_codon:yes stop_codon:yes gene_type:complete